MFYDLMFPSTALDELRREVNRLFDTRFQGVSGGWIRALSFPSVNVWEDGDRVVVEAEIPGLTMDDIEVDVSGDELTIRGERKAAAGQDLTYHRRERASGAFRRTITLPVEVNPDNVEAVLKHGVLTITLPKADQAKARRIPVKTE